MEKRFEFFVQAIFTTEKIVQRIKTHGAKKFGLKAIHVMCIYYLGHSEQGMNSTELCRATLEDKGAISRALTQLDEMGLINSGDKDRFAKVQLSEEGKKISDYITNVALEAVKAGSEGLTDDEGWAFFGVFGRIMENLNKYYEEFTKDE